MFPLFQLKFHLHPREHLSAVLCSFPSNSGDSSVFSSSLALQPMCLWLCLHFFSLLHARFPFPLIFYSTSSVKLSSLLDGTYNISLFIRFSDLFLLLFSCFRNNSCKSSSFCFLPFHSHSENSFFNLHFHDQTIFFLLVVPLISSPLHLSVKQKHSLAHFLSSINRNIPIPSLPLKLLEESPHLLCIFAGNDSFQLTFT